jgi:succinate dehydrogenase / fumarate reductase iron-sulfur subunit
LNATAEELVSLFGDGDMEKNEMSETNQSQPKRRFDIWRTKGDASSGGEGAFERYETEVGEGMVVLDCVHRIQAEQANDLAVRWNCKAGKCGSCSAEINGMPRLLCMTRMDSFSPDEIISIEPMRTFPTVRDLVADVRWNYQVKEKIRPFEPIAPQAADGTHRMMHEDVERIQEFRKCIECFLCQDVCHVLRDHQKFDEFDGPRFFQFTAGLEMHPLDAADRIPDLKHRAGIGYCNITKCCTNVCPENIRITDNAIIPMKERVADRFYDPLMRLLRFVFQRPSANR